MISRDGRAGGAAHRGSAHRVPDGLSFGESGIFVLVISARATSAQRRAAGLASTPSPIKDEAPYLHQTQRIPQRISKINALFVISPPPRELWRLGHHNSPQRAHDP